MNETIQIDGKVFNVNEMSDQSKSTLTSIKYVDQRISETQNMISVLNKAKNAYIESLRKEILSNKSGFLIE